MPSKADAGTKRVKAGALFRLPRSLTDAAYGSAVAAPGQRPVAFMILKMGRPPRDRLIVVAKPIAAASVERLIIVS